MEDLKRKLAEQKRKLPQLASDLTALEQNIDDHLTFCFNPIRRMTEKVLHELCTREEISWGKSEPTLENMSGPLASKRIFPKPTRILVEIIQKVTSPGSHFDVEILSRTHLNIALFAMFDFLDWYYTVTVRKAHGVENVRSEASKLQHEPHDIVKIGGGRQLRGTVTVRGAKNTLPKHMVASLLTSDPCVLRNVADIRDVRLMETILRALGGSIESLAEDAREICTDTINVKNVGSLSRFACQSRIPILLCAPLLHRFGEAVLIEPGGCRIGPRPFDYHVDALRKMGATIEERGGILHVKAERLRGCEHRLPYPSVGATEQILLAAVRADGWMILQNASVEPEVIDLVKLLGKMGAKIDVRDDRTIIVQGVEKLNGFNHKAMADRSEVASWACAAVATGGEILVRNASQDELDPFLAKYSDLGGAFDIKSDGMVFRRKNATLSAVDLETAYHPGFRTDWGPPFVVALTQARGSSTVHETVFENRFCYVNNLGRRGAGRVRSLSCARSGGFSCWAGVWNGMTPHLRLDELFQHGLVGRLPYAA